MNVLSLIRRKRDGETLSGDEIRALVAAYTRDEVPDYQMAAFLMAGFIRGFVDAEAFALYEAMLHSGEVLDLRDIPGIKVDKHSTGGVGDKLSLILAPVAAACGVPVPMISGRGLGHSGGTLDKLESIPGFNVNLDLDRYRRVLAEHRMVLIGQTETIAPADKRLYALRDVTATVECIPYIAASIMSKKMAEGIDALVLDVKVGNGAFMRTEADARRLAERLVAIGTAAGKPTIAYLTDMDTPLGHAIGNWIEVEESLAVLAGGGPADVRELSLLLAGTMIYLGGQAESVEAGIALGARAIEDGSALQAFIGLAAAQDADITCLLHPERYPQAPHQLVVAADRDGWITGMDTFAIGMAAVELGAGRLRKEDRIDPVAGIRLQAKTGDHVKAGQPLAVLLGSDAERTRAQVGAVAAAYRFGDRAPEPKPLVLGRIDPILGGNPLE